MAHGGIVNDMPDLFGHHIERSDLLTRIGDMSQVCDIRRMTFTEGARAGVDAVDISTGSGLAFTVLPSRGLDIASASYRGVPIAWRSPVGEVSPHFFDPEGFEWLRGFFGGLLTTCGMTHASHPCEDEGEKLGLHGRVSHIPAEDVAVSRGWQDGVYRMSVSGRIREAKVFGDNLTLTRSIETSLGSRSIFIRDHIENAGFRQSPLMMLYHVNIGWPILSEHARLVAPSLRANPFDERAGKEPGLWSSFEPPRDGYEERVYLHDMKPDENGTVSLGIVNEQLGLGVRLRYSIVEFPRFIQWKMLGRGEYVAGIEPGNITGNRAAMRRDGTLEFIDPGAERTFTLEITVLEGAEEIRELEGTVRASLSRG